MGKDNVGTEYAVPDFVKRLLKDNGISYYDKRHKGGCLWIVGGKEISDILKQCAEQYEVRFHLKKRSPHNINKDLWWTKDSFKMKSTARANDPEKKSKESLSNFLHNTERETDSADVNRAIDVLDLSKRLCNILHRNGIHTLKDLIETNAYELKMQKGVGEKSLKELHSYLTAYNQRFFSLTVDEKGKKNHSKKRQQKKEEHLIKRYDFIYNLDSRLYRYIEISKLPFHKKIIMNLQSAGMQSLEDLLESEDNKLINIKGMGASSIKEIHDYLEVLCGAAYEKYFKTLPLKRADIRADKYICLYFSKPFQDGKVQSFVQTWNYEEGDSLRQLVQKNKEAYSQPISEFRDFATWCLFDIRNEFRSFVKFRLSKKTYSIVRDRAQGMTCEVVCSKLKTSPTRLQAAEEKAKASFDRWIREKNITEKLAIDFYPEIKLAVSAMISYMGKPYGKTFAYLLQYKISADNPLKVKDGLVEFQ